MVMIMVMVILISRMTGVLSNVGAVPEGEQRCGRAARPIRTKAGASTAARGTQTSNSAGTYQLSSNTLVLMLHDSFFLWDFENEEERGAPLCKQHSKKCPVRRVKQGANSGRRFYACSSPNFSESCGFNGWVSGCRSYACSSSDWAEAPHEQNKNDVSLTNRMCLLPTFQTCV